MKEIFYQKDLLKIFFTPKKPSKLTYFIRKIRKILKPNKALPCYHKAGQIFLAGAKQVRSPLTKNGGFLKKISSYPTIQAAGLGFEPRLMAPGATCLPLADPARFTLSSIF
ncbi:MAG: hypothetical protein AUK09_01155 [Parcubacteria group bacterium CG2_30_36_38]|nr:MAG: hypothetical protein AUK09_01155 [Parcubacteria group bacterium CG2_30_36_38]